jgi:hypothetical protein
MLYGLRMTLPESQEEGREDRWRKRIARDPPCQDRLARLHHPAHRRCVRARPRPPADLIPPGPASRGGGAATSGHFGQPLVERIVARIPSPSPDVDDVPDGLARVAFPGTAADAIGKVGHFVEHGMDLGDHILPVDDDGCPLRRPQRHVQDGAILRDIDLLPPEHGVDSISQAGFLGQLQKKREGFVGDTILRIVEIQADGFAVMRSPRLGSSVKSFRRCHARAFLWWVARAFQARRLVRGVMGVVMVMLLSVLPARLTGA